MPSKAPRHIRLLNMLAAIRSLSPFNMMTAEEDELLRSLIVRWHGSERITMSEIMTSLAGVSETTVYRRLVALRNKGMVNFRADDADRRVKFVEPAKFAECYIEQIRENADYL